MGESKALEILSNYHARDIANFWADYIIEDKDFFVTYKDPESGKKIKLMADDGYCIVIVQIY